MQLVKSLRAERNGYEAWRLIVAEFEPSNDQRGLQLALEIGRGKTLLLNSSMSQFSSQLMMWDDLIRQYEKLPDAGGG